MEAMQQGFAKCNKALADAFPDLRRRGNDKFAAGLKGGMPFKGVGEGSKVVQQLVGDRGDERSRHQD